MKQPKNNQTETATPRKPQNNPKGPGEGFLRQALYLGHPKHGKTPILPCFLRPGSPLPPARFRPHIIPTFDFDLMNAVNKSKLSLSISWYILFPAAIALFMPKRLHVVRLCSKKARHPKDGGQSVLQKFMTRLRLL